MKKSLLLSAVLLSASACFGQAAGQVGAADSVSAAVTRHADGQAKTSGYFADGLQVGPDLVEITARHADGTVFYHAVVHNLKTYAGGDLIAAVMSTTGTQPAAANYMAISTDSGAPAATDTTMAGEVTSNGGSRAQGTYSHTTCSAFPCTYTLAHMWTATGTITGIQKGGVFNASTSGTLVFENTFSSLTMNSGDTLTLTWTISLS